MLIYLFSQGEEKEKEDSPEKKMLTGQTDEAGKLMEGKTSIITSLKIGREHMAHFHSLKL